MTQDTNPYASPKITEEPPRVGTSNWRKIGRVVCLGPVGLLVGYLTGWFAALVGSITLGALFVVASGGEVIDVLPGDDNDGVDVIATWVTRDVTSMGMAFGMLLGGPLGGLLGVIVALWKRPTRKSVTFWTAVVCGTAGSLIGAWGGGILGSPQSQAIWIPIGILIGAMAGSAGGMFLGYAMATLAHVTKRT